MEKVKVNRFSGTYSSTQQQWNHPFNSLLIINYDINAGIKLNNDILIPRAMSITDNVGVNTVPATFSISLNEGEVNKSNYSFDTQKSATANFSVSWTEYAD